MDPHLAPCQKTSESSRSGPNPPTADHGADHRLIGFSDSDHERSKISAAAKLEKRRASRKLRRKKQMAKSYVDRTFSPPSSSTFNCHHVFTGVGNGIGFKTSVSFSTLIFVKYPMHKLGEGFVVHSP